MAGRERPAVLLHLIDAEEFCSQRSFVACVSRRPRLAAEQQWHRVQSFPVNADHGHASCIMPIRSSANGARDVPKSTGRADPEWRSDFVRRGPPPGALLPMQWARRSLMARPPPHRPPRRALPRPSSRAASSCGGCCIVHDCLHWPCLLDATLAPCGNKTLVAPLGGSGNGREMPVVENIGYSHTASVR